MGEVRLDAPYGARWGEAVLWATALTSGLTSGEFAVRLVVGRVPAGCGCEEALRSGIDLLSMDWYAQCSFFGGTLRTLEPRFVSEILYCDLLSRWHRGCHPRFMVELSGGTLFCLRQ